ncbi:RHS repeat domain-containing protein, partial [Elizabethkingia meningoseptica]
AETDWATQSDGTLRRYSYEYDGVNRLKAGNYWDNSGTANGSYAERLNYDLNGNITGLWRTGLGAGLMDELGYSYDQAGNSNKLIRVSDASGNAAGYPVGGNVIGYDVNGNMVNHLDKGISNIVYNYLNLPSSINASIGNTDYVYRADGVKLKKVFGAKTTDYLDGFQYENGVLQFVPTSEGYFDVIKNRYIYNYTDHLGNVRLSYTKGASGGAEIIEENNYYPFGLKHEGYNNASLANSAYKYRYNGKELQETGMYDYGARMYMPDLGRWGVVDPLAEKMTRHSPYNYAFNNPIRFIDPDGRETKDWFWNQKTKKVEWRNSSKNYINEGNGAILSNVGKTTDDVMKSFGIAKKLSSEDIATSGSISWELHEDKEPTKGGIPIPIGKIDGIASFDLTNDLTIGENNGVKFIDKVKTTVNATFSYNDQTMDVNDKTLFYTETSQISKYGGQFKANSQIGLDPSGNNMITKGFGSNFHPVKFKPIEIKTNFSQYTNSGLNFKITLGGTNTTNSAFRYSTYIYNSQKK